MASEWVPKTPAVTVDVIIRLEDQPSTPIVLVRRKFPPHGWALPGGFVDVGESLANAAKREAAEETCLDIRIDELFHCYSNPNRDTRLHAVSAIFLCRATGTPVAADDAARAGLFTLDTLPSPIVFDHGLILSDYAHFLRTNQRPPPGR